jgi:nucleoside-diphosphate-sugar epimerase
VQRRDAARAFRLALDHGKAGARYTPSAKKGISVRKLAELIGKRLGLPLASKTPDEAAEHFGFLAMFFRLDAPASSAFTQADLGWTPNNPD